MACKVKVNRHGFLAFRLYWDGYESWEGTQWKDTPKNREKAQARAILMSEEMEKGTFDYLKWFPEGNKAEQFRPLTNAEPITGNKTISEYYTHWIETKKPPLVRKSRERDYRQYFNCYILPRLADVKLQDIDARLLENFKVQLLGRGLSISTVRRVIDGPLRAMIRDAKKFDGLVVEDPFIVLEWPEAPREKPDPFTEEERDAILSYFRQKASEGRVLLGDYVFPYTLFWTGMRPSETIALRWGDVDLRAEKAEITKSRHLGAEAAPKTRGSRRTIRLLPTVVELLGFMKPLYVTESDYVFRGATGKPLDAAEWSRRHWHKALRAKEIRPRKFYATRHTYISVALSHGVKMKWLAEQCGTSAEMIERNYGRYILDDGDAPLRALLKAQTETLTETLKADEMVKPSQVPENFGATRRSRTGDLLITNRRTVAIETENTQTTPAVSPVRAGDRWGCLGLLGGSSRTKDGQSEAEAIGKRVDPTRGFSVLLPSRDYVTPSVAIGIYSSV
jgi:integrase